VLSSSSSRSSCRSRKLCIFVFVNGKNDIKFVYLLITITMGIYSILIGNGILILRKRLMNMIKKYDTYAIEETDEIDIIDEFVRSIFNDKYSACVLGHDAFESRDKDERMPVFEGTYQMTVLERLGDDYDDLIFIGLCTDLSKGVGEFSYCVKSPELLYGLAVLVPQICEHYLSTKDVDFCDLENYFSQKVLTWTFASDCCFCCG